MTMCLSRTQDDDSMMIVSVEEHRISRVKRACVSRHLMVMTNHKMLSRAQDDDSMMIA